MLLRRFHARECAHRPRSARASGVASCVVVAPRGFVAGAQLRTSTNCSVRRHLDSAMAIRCSVRRHVSGGTFADRAVGIHEVIDIAAAVGSETVSTSCELLFGGAERCREWRGGSGHARQGELTRPSFRISAAPVTNYVAMAFLLGIVVSAGS